MIYLSIFPVDSLFCSCYLNLSSSFPPSLSSSLICCWIKFKTFFYKWLNEYFGIMHWSPLPLLMFCNVMDFFSFSSIWQSRCSLLDLARVVKLWLSTVFIFSLPSYKKYSLFQYFSKFLFFWIFSVFFSLFFRK